MKSFLATSLFLCIASFGFAQRQNAFFLKFDGRYVETRDSADYIRVIAKPDSGTLLFNITEFYLKGNRKRIGKSSVFDPPNYEGTCISFYASGKKQSVVNYKNGAKIGDEYEYYPNGRFYTKLKYVENYTLNSYFGDRNYLIMASSDSLGNELVIDGNGYYKGYDEKFTYVQEEGPVKDGKRDGAWKGEFENPKTTFTEMYNSEGLVSGIGINADGKSTSYTKFREVPPQFKGGNAEFAKFLQSNIRYPNYSRTNNIEGAVYISFWVEKDGELTGVKLIRSVNSDIDKEALRVIKASPKWEPGIRFGELVRVNYIVPVTFILRDN